MMRGLCVILVRVLSRHANVGGSRKWMKNKKCMCHGRAEMLSKSKDYRTAYQSDASMYWEGKDSVDA